MTNRRVLIVDDDEMNRFVMSEMLDMLGYEVVQVPDGHSAIAEAQAQADHIGVILMDVHMPGISGVDATAEIRGLAAHPPARTPILAVTADPSWVKAGAAGEAGFSGALAKPVDFGALKTCLTEFLA